MNILFILHCCCLLIRRVQGIAVLVCCCCLSIGRGWRQRLVGKKGGIRYCLKVQVNGRKGRLIGGCGGGLAYGWPCFQLSPGRSGLEEAINGRII